MLESIQRKLLNLIMFCLLNTLMKDQIPNKEKEEKIQNKRIKKLMKAAYEVPFYRARFEQVGLKPSDFNCAKDLEKFPLLTKAELREWIEEESKDPKYKDYYLDTTSGSSGTPTKVLYSPVEKAYNMANWMRVLMKAGYNPYLGKTVSRLSAHSASAKQKNFFQNFGILRRDFINQYEDESTIIKNINEMKPDLLYMNKTELMRIALFASSHNLKVHNPKFFVPTGEMIDENARKLFRSVFGPGMIDSFGTAETGACMAKFPGSDEYRIHGDLFVVNLYDENGNCSNEGKLTVTPLYKLDVPLINYVVGDQATSREENGVKFITSLKGRSNDFIQHENGEVTTFFMIAPVIAHAEDILQFRLIQKSYDLLVLQAVWDESSKNDRNAIEDSLREQLVSRLKAPMNIEFNWVDVIQPDKNGKLRLIVNEMKD